MMTQNRIVFICCLTYLLTACTVEKASKTDLLYWNHVLRIDGNDLDTVVIEGASRYSMQKVLIGDDESEYMFYREGVLEKRIHLYETRFLRSEEINGCLLSYYRLYGANDSLSTVSIRNVASFEVTNAIVDYPFEGLNCYQ
jgi:hypothetical protein